MLIVGDIGGAKTGLALVSSQAGPRKFVAEQEFGSADYRGLRPIVEASAGSTSNYGALVPRGSPRVRRRKEVAKEAQIVEH